MRGLSVASHLFMVINGGYAMSAGLMALIVVSLPTVIVQSRSDTVVLAPMLAFLVYLILLIWAFAERRLPRFCAILVVVETAAWAGSLGLARPTF